MNVDFEANSRVKVARKIQLMIASGLASEIGGPLIDVGFLRRDCFCGGLISGERIEEIDDTNGFGFAEGSRQDSNKLEQHRQISGMNSEVIEGYDNSCLYIFRKGGKINEVLKNCWRSDRNDTHRTFYERNSNTI